MFGEMADWKRITDTGKINGLIEDHGIFTRYAAGLENSTVSVASGLTDTKLFYLLAVWRLVASKSTV